jgi:hypothetical protein
MREEKIGFRYLVENFSSIDRITEHSCNFSYNENELLHPD